MRGHSTRSSTSYTEGVAFGCGTGGLAVRSETSSQEPSPCRFLLPVLIAVWKRPWRTSTPGNPDPARGAESPSLSPARRGCLACVLSAAEACQQGADSDHHLGRGPGGGGGLRGYPDRPALAGRAGGSRGGPPGPVPEQPQANRPGPAQLRVRRTGASRLPSSPTTSASR